MCQKESYCESLNTISASQKLLELLALVALTTYLENTK